MQFNALTLIVGLFQASPNASIDREIDALLTNGLTLADLAANMGDSPLFNSLYPADLSPQAFATAFLRELLGIAEDDDFSAPVTPAYFRLASEWLAANVAAHGRGDAAWQAISALAQADYFGPFGAARLRLENRIDVSEHFIASDHTANTLPELQAVLAEVTSSSLSVVRAKAAIGPPSPVKSPGTSEGSWTLMVYMAADNDLEPFAFEDLNEMEAAVLPPNVNIVVVMDRAPGYDISNGNWSDTRIGVVTHDDDPVQIATTLQSVGEFNMGATATLTAFVNWAISERPAENYGLIFWGHGRGIDGVAFDQTSGNDALQQNEIRSALTDSAAGRLALVGFDTCSMSMLEQAYSLYGLADVMLASQDYEPGNGWNYQTWLTDVFDDSANISPDVFTLASAAINSYGAEYPGQKDITLAATLIDSTPPIRAALQNLLVQTTQASPVDWLAIRMARQQAEYFPDAQAIDLIDFADYLGQRTGISPGLAVAAQAVATTAQDSIYQMTSSEAGGHGLSIYWPSYKPYGYAQSYTPDNVGLLGQVAWHDFLLNYWIS
jgi:hypothetical protein